MKKRAFISFISLVLCFALSIQASAAPVAQIFPEHWSSQAINQWNGRGWLDALSQKAINPDAIISRADFAALCDVLFGYKEKGTATYKDIPSESPFYGYVMRASEAGVIKGYDGFFRPNEPITREEVAVMISAALYTSNQGFEKAIEFADGNSIAEWSKSSISALTEKKIMVGYPDGSFKPQNNLTIAEAISLLNRAAPAVITASGEFAGEVAGNLFVKGKDVALRNMKISGDLFIAQPEAGSKIYLDNVEVSGRIYITGAESIEFKATPAEGKVLVNSSAGPISVKAPTAPDFLADLPLNVKYEAPAAPSLGYSSSGGGVYYYPTAAPTAVPTTVPTDAPSPTDAPAPSPTDAPAQSPTEAPAPSPTDIPAPSPTDIPEDATSLPLIKVASAMIYDPQNNGTAEKFKLFDEFSEVEENPPNSENPYLPPIDSMLAKNENTWRSPGGSWNELNTQFTINFGSDCEIYEIWVYDGPVYAPATYVHQGTVDKEYEVYGGSFEIYSGASLLGTIEIGNSGQWKKLSLQEGFTSGTLTFKKVQEEENRYSWTGGGWTSDIGQYVCDVNVPEVAIMGIPLGPLTEDESVEWELAPSDVEPVEYDFTFGQFFGTNAHFNEPFGNLDAIGLVREYHNWSWTEWSANDHADSTGTKNSSAMTTEPTVAFMNTWGSFDNYYESLFNAGIEAVICIQGGIIGAPQSRPNFQGDLDSLKASSYLAHGQSMFQHAARYGSVAVDESLLKVAAGTEKRTGLGWVEYFENWNEANLGPWNGAQFAAMTSADYDGHMGTMGPDVGVKQADPNAKLVLGGLAGIIYDESAGYDPAGKGFTARKFVEEFIKWCDLNRTKEQWLENHDNLDGYVKYPFDVFNGHYYSPDGYGTTGLSPESDHVLERMQDFVEFKDAYFPEKEIWLSEYGYDSEQGSPQSATVTSEINAGLTGQEVQGRWLVREALILAAAGLDRVTQFEMDDYGDGGMGHSATDRFESCGMINTQGDKTPKPSWYYMGTANFLLKTAKLDNQTHGIIEKGGDTGLNGPWVLDFKETDEESPTTDIFALWLPTSLGDKGGANRELYRLELPEGTTHAYQVDLKDKVKWGERSELEIISENGKLFVDANVTEKPIFILANTDEYYKPIAEVINPRNFTVGKLTQSAGDPAKLFDENCKSTDAKPSIDANSNPGAWNPGALNSYAFIDLGAKYNLTDILIYDKNGSLKAGKVFAVHAYKGIESTLSLNLGNVSSDDAASLLAGEDWERVATHNFSLYDAWQDSKVNVATRYLIAGFEDGPNTLPYDQWETEILAVPEIMLKGSLARGETPPPPFIREFEEKPSSQAFEFLYDNDFDSEGDAYSTYNANVSLIDATNANNTHGKILKFEGTASSPEFTIPASYLSSLEANRWYYVDFKFKLDDENSAPKLTLLNSWSPIFSNSGGGNRFKPQWSDNSGIKAAVSDEWHQLKSKIMIDSAGIISYEVFYDGASIGAAKTTMVQTLPLEGIRIQFIADAGKTSVYYLDDVWVYSAKVLNKLDPRAFAFRPIQNVDLGWMGAIEKAFNEQLPPDGAAISTPGTPQGADPGNGNPVPGPLPSYQYDAWGLGVDRFYLIDLGDVYDITDIYLMTKNNQATNVPFYIWYGPGESLPWNSDNVINNPNIQQELAENWNVAYSELLIGANGFPDNGWGPPAHYASPITARYIILGCTNFVEGGAGSSTFSLQEIVFYGTKSAQQGPQPQSFSASLFQPLPAPEANEQAQEPKGDETSELEEPVEDESSPLEPSDPEETLQILPEGATQEDPAPGNDEVEPFADGENAVLPEDESLKD
ncbi:MAG: S-layer homology domain-containing protein [Clostridiales bacterium]|jgi:hypothetical protein|nr:S-layer homology domain-containing protein [Clostridiales bacterium]